jgi:hypothetical protein
MKITSRQLNKIIREEINALLVERPPIDVAGGGLIELPSISRMDALKAAARRDKNRREDDANRQKDRDTDEEDPDSMVTVDVDDEAGEESGTS